jgi:cytochrome P450
MTLTQDTPGAAGTTGGGACPVTGNRAAGGCPVPHGPKGLPVIGVAPTYFKDPAAFTLGLQQQYGPMVSVNLPKPYVLVTDPEVVEHVTKTNPDNYRRGELYKGFLGFMGKGMLTLNDAEWRPHRSIVAPAFTIRRVNEKAEEAVPATEALLARWAGAARTGAVIDIAEDAMNVSTRTMGKALLGRDLSEAALDYANAAAIASKVMYTTTIFGLNELLPSFLPTRYNRDKKKAHRIIDGVIDGVISSRRRSGDLGTDAAGKLLASGELTDQDIRDDLRTLLLAGTDTTGQALAWTLYEIARHPWVREEVEEEVDRVLGGHAPTTEQRGELPVTRSVIEEAMRLHPPVWQFPRDLIEDEQLGRWDVKKDTTLVLSTYGTHRNAEHWRDPHTFDPRRFRDGSAKERPAGSYFPFGGGRRQCIGKNLAMATLITAVAMISQRFRISLTASSVPTAAFITMYPAEGVHATLRERS